MFRRNNPTQSFMNQTENACLELATEKEREHLNELQNLKGELLEATKQMQQAHEDAMLKERTRIKNPPPITDYSDPRDEDPLLARAKVLITPHPFSLAN